MNNSGLYRGCLEPIVLQLLKERKRMYGYEITQEVKQRSNGALHITEGALYPLLHRLEADGALEVETAREGNRIRKYYKLTEAGKKASAKAMDELKSFLETMHTIIKPQFT